MNDKPKFNPKMGKDQRKGLPQRRSIRLKGYDYSQAGLYFITICCQDRICLFGDVVKGEIVLNEAGKMVETEWLNLPDRFKNIELHESVIMPNHFHGILKIVGVTLVVARNVGIAENQIGQPQGIAPTKTIGDMMDAYKSITTVNYIRGVKTLNWQPFNGKLWQRNYWEHIIRNEQSYQRISEYIINNPKEWSDDKFHTP
ncbi:transposase [Algoriphagus antarcticus]|nr:transposase [Algoriphagus antarcticus]